MYVLKLFKKRGGGGGGRTRANSVCFNTQNWVKIGGFLNVTPTSWGRQIFPKSPKENRNSLTMSTACLCKKIDLHTSYAFTGKRTKPRENTEVLNMDSQSGQYEGF